MERRKLLTITEAADILGVHQKTLRSWANKGLVPHVKTPTGHRRFDPEELIRFRNEMAHGGHLVSEPRPTGYDAN